MEWLATILGFGASAASGGLVGALVRFIPEVIGVFKAKADRAHEIAMRRLDWEIAKSGSEQRIREADAAGYWDAEGKQLEALREALTQQGKLTGIGWVDAMSQTVRPVFTYWMMILYSVMKFVMFGVAAADPNVGAVNALPILWGYADNQMFFGIVGFWFVNRELGKRASGV